MYFLYKTISGEVGKVDKVHMLPCDIDVLIVKEFDRKVIRLPYSNKLVLDLNYNSMVYLRFKTDVLSVYRSYSGWFRFEIGRYFRVLKHLDMRGITNMDSCFRYTGVEHVCKLNMSNVILTDRMFSECTLKSIPILFGSSLYKINRAFNGSYTPKEVVKTIGVLNNINKR